MKYKFINVIMFAAGAAIGSAVTWKFLKTKYERIAQEEIESVKTAFEGVFNDAGLDSDEESNDEDEVDDLGNGCTQTRINWADYEDLDEEDEEIEAAEEEYQEDQCMNEYEKLVNSYITEKGGANDMGDKPYVIDPYDFGEKDGYKCREFVYYSDGTLEDEKYNIINNVDEIIGSEALDTFGQYEEYSVFVRNDTLRTDFQILKDYRSYNEARHIGPNRVGD